jgi:hypothetical protein
VKDEDKHNEEMDKFFQGAFAQWEPKPEPAAWDKVEARLNRRRKKRIGILIIGTILIGLVGIWYFWPDGKSNKETVVTGSSNTSSIKQLNNNSTTTVNSNSVASEKSKQPVANTSAQAQSIKDKNLFEEHQVKASSAKAIGNGNNTGTSVQTNNNSALSTRKKNHSNSISIPKSIAMNNGNTAATVSHRKSNTVSEKSTVVKQDNVSKSKNIENETVKNKPATNNETDKNKQQAEAISANSPSRASDSNLANMNIADQKSTTLATTSPSVKDTAKSTIITADNKAAETSSDLKQDKPPGEKDNNTETIKKDSTLQNAYAVAKKDSIPKQNSRLHKLSISLYGSPEISKNKVTSANAQFNIQDAKTNTRFSVGAKFNLKLGKHFELNIGVAYSQYSQSNKLDSAILVKNDTVPYRFVTSMGTMSIPDSSMLPTGTIVFSFFKTFQVYYKYTENVQFINIPINARYSFGTGKLRPYVTAGINLQYLLAADAYLEVIRDYSVTQIIDKHFTYNSLDVTRFNFGPSAGAGLEYKLTDRLDVYVEPNARLNMYNLSGSANSTNYFLGCQAGVRIGL